MIAPAVRTENPFPGLRPYEEYQADLFFGRDEQVDQLLDKLEARRFIAVVGSSGSGKSSLVRAGLVPALRRGFIAGAGSVWRTVVMRPGSEPVRELALPLAREFNMPEASLRLALDRSCMGLAEFVRQNLRSAKDAAARPDARFLNGGENLLLVVDQFEEIFRFTRAARPDAASHDESAAFVKLLLSAVGRSDVPVPGIADLPVYIVLTMRSDFLGKCAQFRGLPEALNDSQYLVPRMTREQLLESIEGPIAMSGAKIAPRLAQQLLNDAGENPNLLPVLQHLLTRLWEESEEARQAGEPIDLQHYERPSVGGMDKALNLDADRAYRAVGGDDRDEWMVQRIFERLVEPGPQGEETRRPTPLSELIAICEAPEAEIRRLIQPFRDRGFLTLSEDADPVLDISHESLIRLWNRLGKWVKAEVESAAIYKRLADSAMRNLALYRDPELTQAQRWKKRTLPNEAWAARYSDAATFQNAMQFLRRSQRAQRWRMCGMIGAIAVLCAFTIMLAVERHLAKKATRAALVGHLTGQAAMLLHENTAYAPTVALLAMNSLSRESTPDGHRMLQEAIELLPRQLKSLDHSETVWAVAFSPDGKLIAAGTNDGLVRVFNTASYRKLWENKYDGWIASVAFSPDSRWLVTGGSYGGARVLDALTGKRVAEYSSSNLICSVAFSPDGRSVAVATGDKNDGIQRFDAATGTALPIFKTATAIYRVTFSPDGRRLSAASRTGRNLEIFDVATRKPVHVLEQSWVMSSAFSPSGRRIAVARSDSTVRVLDVESGMELSRVELESPVNDVAFGPTGHLVAAGSDGNSAVIFEAATGRLVSQLLADGPVTAVAFNAKGDRVAIGSTDKTVRVFATMPGLHMSDFADEGVIHDIEFTSDLKTGVVTSEDGTARIFDVDSGTESFSFKHPDHVSTAAFSRDKQYVITGDEKGTIRLFSVSGRQLKWQIKGDGFSINDAQFSEDGSRIAIGSENKTVRLLEAATGNRLWSMPAGDGVNQVAFSRDGKFLAIGATDKTARVFSVSTGAELAQLPHPGVVFRIAFSPDAQTLATGADDSILRIYDARTGKMLKHFPPQENRISAIAYSPNGNYIATSNSGHIVRVFDLSKPEDRAEISVARQPYNVFNVQFSPDSRSLLSAGPLEASARGQNHTLNRVWYYREFFLTRDLMDEGCSRLTGNLTAAEWKKYVGDEPYRKTCPSLP